MEFEQKIRKILQKYWQQTIITTSSTSKITPGNYQPGGTLALLGHPWTGGAIPNKDLSGMGRWTSIKIQGRQNTTLHLITTYRVPKMTISNAGPNTSYYHQWHHLRRQGIPVPDPRQFLLNDLGQYITTIKNDKSAIIIAMDANEAYTDRNSALMKWMTQHSLVDLHMALYNLDTNIPTHNRGNKRIDYIFGTYNIVPYVENGGILPFHFLKSTDHRGLYIDIDLNRFLKCQPPLAQTIPQRTLQTNNPKGYIQYCQQIEQWISSSQIELTLQQMTQDTSEITPQQISRIIQLEKEFTDQKLQAEKRMIKKYTCPWSPTLKIAQLRVYYYKLWLSQYQTGKDYHKQRARLSLSSPKDPTTKQQAQTSLREAQKALKETKL